MRDIPPEIYQTSEQEIAELFRIFDEDNNDYIDKLELVKMYHEIGHEMDVAQAEAMIAQVDVDGDKQINLQEFNQLMLNFKQERALDQDDQLDRFRAMFCDADTDYSGYLSVDEIYSVMLK